MSLKTFARAIQPPASLAHMRIVDRMWVWGFVAGVFLMGAINSFASAINGGGGSDWIQMVGSLVVVLAAIMVSLRLRKTESATRTQTRGSAPTKD